MTMELGTKNVTPPLAALVSEALEKFAARGDRRLIPRGKEGTESQIPYLYRNFLNGQPVPDGEPGLLLHKFVSSDKEGQLHNHPWRWSYSFILIGRYRETRSQVVRTTKSGLLHFAKPVTRDLEAGECNFIRDTDFHRVELITPHVWTLFLHGPRTGEWGFASENYKRAVKLKVVKGRTYNVREKVNHAKG